MDEARHSGAAPGDGEVGARPVAPEVLAPPPPPNFSPSVSPGAPAPGVGEPRIAPHQTAAPVAAGTITVKGRLYRPAGLWPRVAAFLIDFVILAGLFWVLSQVVAVPELDRAKVFAARLTVVFQFMLGTEVDEQAARLAAEAGRRDLFSGWLNVLMCCAYFTLFHGLLGASLGKLALGLRVMRSDGRPIGLPWAFLRYLGYLAVARLYYTAWLIPLDRQRRTLYDIVLGTNVFSRGS